MFLQSWKLVFYVGYACMSTSQRRIENYLADFLMMELRRMYLWYISLAVKEVHLFTF